MKITKPIKLFFLYLIFSLSVNGINAQISGNSLRLKADTNYVSIEDASSQSLNNTMTWEFWIYNRCGNSGGTILSKGWCNSEWSYLISIESDSGKLNFQKFSATNSCVNPSITVYHSPNHVVPINTWTHVALVMSGTSLKFYINGVAVLTTLESGTPFVGINSSVDSLLIGAYHFGTFSGDRKGDVPKANIDEVRIWHKARTANEILTHYQTTLVGNEAGLKAYYKMNETGSGTGITVTNSAVGSSIPNGITVGKPSTLLFENNSTIINGTQNCILPLQLLSFTVTNDNRGNWLNWITSREINVDRFEIERSYNGRAFNKIDQIKAGLTSYTFCDKKPSNETCYYRLKMLNKDGTFTYSKIVSVKLPSDNSITIHPNPSHGLVQLLPDKNMRGLLNISITDISGKVLLQKTAEANGANISINTTKLAAGTYTVKVVSGGEVFLQKLIVE